MPRTKTKPSRRIDDDEDENETLVVETAPEPVRAPRTDSMHEREQLGLEVASDLTLGGLAAFLAVTTKGVNLVAANAAATAFVPVRIVSEDDGAALELKAEYAEALAKADGVVAFLIGEDGDRTRWYVPAREYLAKTAAGEGREGVLSLDLDEHETWLRPFTGHAGVKRAFARLLK
jgi:hypothetical protein